MSILSVMLKNTNIKKWYDEFTYSNAESTAKVYVRGLYGILNGMKESPESIIELDKDTLYNKMFERAIKEKNRGMAPSYIVSEFKALYSYLKHNDIDFKRIPNPKNATSTPTVQNEKIPTKEELSSVLQLATPRDKISISLMAFSGVRPGVIGNSNGDKGLVMGDLDGWKIKGNEIIFETPVMITVKSNLSKTSKQYITFLCEEGSRHLKNYIDARIRNDEEITNRSPVVRSVFQKKIDFICTNAITNGIKISLMKAGVEKRPYVLRRYFASMMQEGEHNGLVIHSFNQFFMGHTGDMMATYTMNKGLSPSQLEDMKESYKRCQRYLQTDVTRVEIERTQERMAGLETKSKNMEEILFDRINKLEKDNNGLKEIINMLKFDNNELQKWLIEIGEHTGIMKNKKVYKDEGGVLRDSDHLKRTKNRNDME